jgi:hypothetical protein
LGGVIVVAAKGIAPQPRDGLGERLVELDPGSSFFLVEVHVLVLVPPKTVL